MNVMCVMVICTVVLIIVRAIEDEKRDRQLDRIEKELAAIKLILKD